VCRVTAVAIRLDEARRVVLWRGGLGEVCYDGSRLGMVRLGEAVVARCVVVRSVRRSLVCFGEAVTAG